MDPRMFSVASLDEASILRGLRRHKNIPARIRGKDHRTETENQGTQMTLSTSILRLICDKPMNRKDLLFCLRQEGYKITDRSMRDHIAGMISDEDFCIKSSEKGYELIRERTKLNEAVRYIDSYIIELSERKRKLIQNFDNQNLTQLKLSL